MVRAIDELEFLSEAALGLAELGPKEDLCRFVAEQLARVVPDTLVMTISFDPETGLATVRGVTGPPDMVRRATTIAGEAVGRVLEVDRQAREILAEGQLTRVDEGMHQLTFRTWPRELADRFEHELGIQSVWGQPFSRRGDFLGAVAFASRAPALAHPRLVEVFVRQAAVAIQRRRAEARLRASEERFRMLAESSRDVIFKLRVRPSLGVEYACPAVEWLLGLSPAELYADARLGAPALFPESWLTDGLPRALPAEAVLAESRRRDGSEVWMEQKFTAMRDRGGEVVGVAGIARDVTRRKHAEDLILDADRRKTEFLGVLSHELRNPLGVIRNATYVLGVAGAQQDQGRRAIAVIERQIVQLTRLVDDLLDLTRIARGKIQLQRELLDVAAIVRPLIDDYATACERAGITIARHEAAVDTTVFGDRARLSQIVDNLLNNAVKFTPRGGRISVDVGADPATRRAIVRVHNTGSWIPAELQAKLFVPFVQANHTLDRSRGGLGLGLALVKGLVEMHGGVVEVESDQQAGTAFAVHLPLAAMHATATPRPDVAEQPTAAPRRILVIEDNEDAAETIRIVLELDGHEVAVARTGRDGLVIARSFHPDLVVCDIGLPEMSGYDVARALRADPGLQHLPLIALTGYAGPDDVRLAREAGFDRHLSKPLALPALGRAIAELTAPATISSLRGSRGAPAPP